MKEITIAFDVDGTLISNTNGLGKEHINLVPFQLMVLLSKQKNVRIMVWSGGGMDYANQIVLKYGLQQYVDIVIGKQDYDELLHGHVDIAFDDQHEFALADKNIIVRVK